MTGPGLGKSTPTHMAESRGININGSVPDCGISSASALEIPQSSTEPLIFIHYDFVMYFSNADAVLHEPLTQLKMYSFIFFFRFLGTKKSMLTYWKSSVDTQSFLMAALKEAFAQ